jgi:hypothetical protein
MNFRDTAELTIKTSTSTAGVSDYIKAELKAIPVGQALAMVDLVKAVLANCPTVPSKHQAYTRINNALSRNFGKAFVKLQGDDGYTYIAKREVKVEVVEEVEVTVEDVEVID